MPYWSKRLADHQLKPADRLGERAISFADPDGIALEMVGVHEAAGEPWGGGPVPVEHAIRGFHAATLSEEGYESTAKVLTDLMGFRPAGSEGNRFRYRAGAESSADGVAQIIDVLCVPGAPHGGMGAGNVHHIAFRTADDPQQIAWREKIVAAGLNVSPVIDRSYFHSIYYREPGGVLFEIATENPGFAVDEPAAQLGTKLKLPPQYERYRAEIEAVLPKVRRPEARG
jgi:glyoxalase family protein